MMIVLHLARSLSHSLSVWGEMCWMCLTTDHNKSCATVSAPRWKQSVKLAEHQLVSLPLKRNTNISGLRVFLLLLFEFKWHLSPPLVWKRALRYDCRVSWLSDVPRWLASLTAFRTANPCEQLPNTNTSTAKGKWLWLQLKKKCVSSGLQVAQPICVLNSL